MTEEKKSYTVIYEDSNGYLCGCCRHSWTYERDYENVTLDELADIVANEYLKLDRGDVQSIREESPNLVDGEFWKVIQTRIKEQETIAEEKRQREKAEKEKQDAERREQRKRIQYEKLKKEFEGTDA